MGSPAPRVPGTSWSHEVAMPVRVSPVFSRGRQDGVNGKCGAGEVEHARYDDEVCLCIWPAARSAERHGRVGEHDVAVEQESHVEHANERQWHAYG